MSSVAAARLSTKKLSALVALIAIFATATVLLQQRPASKLIRPLSPQAARHLMPKQGEPGDETAEALNAAAQFAEARTAPGLVLPGAYLAAFTSLTSLATTGGSWTELTSRPYDSDDPRFRDPVNSNSGGGAGFVAGRITGLAISGSTIFAGGADGGVFRSSNAGGSWTPGRSWGWGGCPGAAWAASAWAAGPPGPTGAAGLSVTEIDSTTGVAVTAGVASDEPSASDGWRPLSSTC